MHMPLRLLQVRHECGSTVRQYFERDFGRTSGSPKFQNIQYILLDGRSVALAMMVLEPGRHLA